MKKKKYVDEEDYFGENDEPKTLPRPQPGVPPCKYDRWPETVPVLTAADMCWSYSAKGVRYDLLEWLDIAFACPGVRINPKREVAKATLEAVLAERLDRKRVDLWYLLEEAKREKTLSLAWQAFCWNEAMDRLGFDIPEESRRDPGIKDKRHVGNSKEGKRGKR